MYADTDTYVSFEPRKCPRCQMIRQQGRKRCAAKMGRLSHIQIKLKKEYEDATNDCESQPVWLNEEHVDKALDFQTH